MQNEILKPVLETDETAIPRYDIVNPDGSVAQQNVELRLKNEVMQQGTPYDEESVLPANLATQLGLPTTATPAQALQLIATKSYNKDETLSNETKTLFGLDETAVPDDVFTVLCKTKIDKMVVQKIEKSMTWVAPKAVNQLFKVMACGGGGGGYPTDQGGNGGGGGYVVIQNLTIPQGTNVDIICGAGGTGGTSSVSATDGGDTSFGNYLTAAGGKGGTSAGGGDGGAGGGSVRGNGGNGSTYGGGGGVGGRSLAGATAGNGGTYGGGGGTAHPFSSSTVFVSGQ